MTVEVLAVGGGIYCIRNRKNGKSYVGSAVSFKVRWKGHRVNLRRGSHHSQKLQRAWDKHGEDMFEFAVLECVKDPATLVEREQVWIDKLNAHKGGYNVSPTAGSVLGVKHNEAMREKMRAIRAANPITPEQHARMADGRRNSEKFKAHVSQLGASQRGRKHTPEAIEKISAASKRRMSDPEQREQQRAASTGFKHSQETIEKLRAVPRRKGWKHTPEALEKIRQASLGRRISAETIEKRRATRRRNEAAKVAA